MPQPRRLTFITTGQCDVHCGHCLMECERTPAPHLTSEQILSVVGEARKSGPVDLVVLSGGEPTLLGDELLEALACLSGQGIMTRIVTNARWASTPARARAMIRNLRECGLTEINFSYDDFHTKWIPESSLVNAWEAAMSAGFAAVLAAVAVGPRSAVDVDRMRALLGEDVPVVEFGTDFDVPEAADGTIYAISRGRYSRLGRARRMPDDEVYHISLAPPVGPCHEVLPGSTISETFHVGICCGARPDTMSGLLPARLDEASYGEQTRRLGEDPLVRALATLGPAYLHQLVARAGVPVRTRSSYTNMCEVCEDLARDPQACAALWGMRDEIRAAMDVADKVLQSV